ncbi:MAG: TRAP transporter large permease [Thermoleophilia bacterium]|nr:TRAP transporter large permease [Thermoleophilia bacterium]
MSTTTIGLIFLVALLVLVFLKMPIGFTMAFVGFVGFAILSSLKGALNVVGIEPFAAVSNYSWGAISLFILMGQFAFRSGIVERLYVAVDRWLGALPGGVAMATIAACGGFSAVSSSSVATAATMASVALPEMKKYNYSDALAAGTVAAGGTLGILIPPSAMLMTYGILTESSIAQLFLAGLIPGILLALLFIASIALRAWRNPSLAPRGAKATMRERIRALPGVIDMVLLIVLVLGGLWGGLFTANEAGAVGAFGALAIGLARRKLSLRGFLNSLSSTVRMTAMLIAIVVGTMIFNRFLTVSLLPSWLASAVDSLTVSPTLIIVAILVMYALLGCVFDTVAVVMLTIPILFPVIQTLGIDPIWYGVAVTITTEMGLITPPIGINVFVVAAVAPQIPIGTIFRGIVPFLIPMVLLIALLVAFPQIATALVHLVY